MRFGRIVDVTQARFKEAARQPLNFRILRIVDVFWRRVTKLFCEFLARYCSTVEPDAVFSSAGKFFLGCNFERNRRLRFECSGQAVHWVDLEAIARAWLSAVIAPEETLHGMLVRVKLFWFRRISRIEGFLGIRLERLKNFRRPQPFRWLP